MNPLPLRQHRIRYYENVLHVASLRGMSVVKLVDRARIDDRTWLRVRHAEPVSPATRRKIAQALQVSDRSLCDESPAYFGKRDDTRVAHVTKRDFAQSYNTHRNALGLCRTLQVRRIPWWTRLLRVFRLA